MRYKQPSPGEVNVKAPVIEKDLLDYLDSLFPARLPPAGTDPRVIDGMIGARGPIDHLHELFALQTETEITDVLR